MKWCTYVGIPYPHPIKHIYHHIVFTEQLSPNPFYRLISINNEPASAPANENLRISYKFPKQCDGKVNFAITNDKVSTSLHIPMEGERNIDSVLLMDSLLPFHTSSAVNLHSSSDLLITFLIG